MKTFKAFVSRKQTDGSFSRAIEERSIDDLPEGEVLVRVHYAALNYKDALSAHGHKGISRNFPHTPGVDAAGIVAESSSADWKAGDEVIVTSFDLGMNTSGAFAEYIRVPAHWVVRKPENLSLQESMIIGTGGFTAALSLYKMELCGQHPEMGPILVTGATGGVGSMAVAIFSKCGYEVIASTGKADESDYLKSLGASTIEGRDFANDTSGRPLLRSKWAGAVDTVGGNTLATAIKACGRNGSIALCGLVASPDLETTVYPFILNGVNVLGIETAETPLPIRHLLWEKLSSDWKPDHLEAIKEMISLAQLDEKVTQILAGKVKGRVVVDLS